MFQLKLLKGTGLAMFDIHDATCVRMCRRDACKHPQNVSQMFLF